MSEEFRKTTRRSTRRRMMSDTEGSGPEPVGLTSSACGHDSCSGSVCHVRYVGMTSHVRDHHILHAARGVSHIWSAAIITGFAVVLTGTVAFSAVEARGGMRRSGGGDMAQVLSRLETMERTIKDVRELCSTAQLEKEMPKASDRLDLDSLKKKAAVPADSQ